MAIATVTSLVYVHLVYPHRCYFGNLVDARIEARKDVARVQAGRS